MALPKISMPLFEETLPSNKMEVLYRPFTVKEEKILLIAQQSKDFKQAILAIKQILNNCITSKNEKEPFDVSKIPVFDLEYILLKLRAKSIDNKIKLSVKDKETEKSVDVEVDLDNMELKTFDGHTNMVKLNETYSLYLKYPTIDSLIDIADENLTDAEKSFNIMVSCMDKLISEESTYDFTEETNESVIEFLDDLDPKAIVGIKKFFDTTPRIRHEIHYTNENGNEKTFVIEGTETFFI